MADTKISALTADTGPTVDDLVPTVTDPGGTPANRKVTLANLLKIATMQTFYPKDAHFPSTAYATHDTMGTTLIPVLDFDGGATEEYCYFSGRMPLSYGGGDIVIEIGYTSGDTANTVGWEVAMEYTADGVSTTTDGFATDKTVTAVTVPGTANLLDVVSVTLTAGATDTDSVVAGGAYRLRVRRDTSVDTSSGFDASLHWVTVREA
jgi:hypothetical protein